MVIDKIKQLISKSKLFRIALMILIIALFGLYFLAFFTTGAKYDDTFLKKEVVASDTHYVGRNIWGTIHITVKSLDETQRNFNVIYRLPNNINKAFTVNFTEADNNLDRGVIIKDESGSLLFEGEYHREGSFLFDKNGHLFIDGISQASVSGQSPYNSYYKIYLGNVVSFAAFENDTIRGDVRFLLLAVFLIILTAIDMRFPLFFFKLKYAFAVNDPEPSDFFLAMQRISWYAYSIIAFILLICAVF